MIKLTQVEFSSIESKEYDLIIASSGFEERAVYQIGRVNLAGAKKIVLGFSTEREDSVRKSNDQIFKESGFAEVLKDGHGTDNIYFRELISEFLKDSHKSEIDVLVDYSSMTRNWYAQLLLYFHALSGQTKVNVYFCYSFAEYEPAKRTDILNKVVEPIFGYCNLSVPIKPTALIICLGNELNRAYGLKEYFDAATFLFYSDPHVNNSYSDEVVTVNDEIIRNTPPEHIFQYPITNLMMSNFILNNLCEVLSEKYRVVIAPCGPKPFTLLALVSSLNKNGKIEVWRISPAENIAKYARKPSGEILVLKAIFGD